MKVIYRDLDYNDISLIKGIAFNNISSLSKLWVAFEQKYYPDMSIHVIEEVFADTKGVIRIRKSKNSQRNGDHKKIESTNNDSQKTLHIKLEMEKHEPRRKSFVKSGAPEG